MKLQILLFIAIFANVLYSQDGTLDLEFGNEGFVTTAFSGFRVQATSIAEQPDGKIVIVGNGIPSSPSEEIVVLARYLASGDLDTDFADGGKLIIDISNFFTVCEGVAIDEDNNIFLGGHYGDEVFQFKAFVLKLDMNGDLDQSFADSGIWRSEKEGTKEFMDGMKLLGNGKILLSGKSTLDDEISAAVIRVNENGSLDEDFGIDGYAYNEIPSGYFARFMEVGSNGEIVVGGSLSGQDILLAKFNEEGGVVNNFGENGVLIDDGFISESPFDMIIQDDNKIIVSFAQENAGRKFGLVRYNLDGSTDSEYGENGRVLTDFSVFTNSPRSIVLQEDQKIIQSGFIFTGGQVDCAIVRIDSNGDLDPSFGNEGKVTTNFGLDEVCEISVLQADGNLLCGGIYREATAEDGSLMVARYFAGITVNIADLVDDLIEVKVIPNPAKGKFNISLSLKTSSTTSIDLLKPNGSIVQSIVQNKTLDRGVHKLGVSLNRDISHGLYFLRIQTENGNTIEQVVIE